jgi:hypothetical protein
MAEAVVTGVVTGVVAGPGGSGTLDVTGMFVDSLRHAEPFRAARRAAQWRGACRYKSLKGRADVTDWVRGVAHGR